jgi:hypothetical protein
VSDRPKVTKYLVMWPDKKIGGFEREDVLMIALAENRSMGEAQGIQTYLHIADDLRTDLSRGSERDCIS